MKFSQNQSGFTLMELLVIISIISFLANLTFTSINTARSRARESRRLADMKQIQTALALYAADHNGQYPSTGGVLACLGIPSTEKCWDGIQGQDPAVWNPSATGPKGNDALNAALGPYLDQISKDPLYSKRVYGTYVYRSPGYYWLPTTGNINGAYALAFEVEMSPNNDADCLDWKWAAWDSGYHCQPYCRHCGYLDPY